MLGMSGTHGPHGGEIFETLAIVTAPLVVFLLSPKNAANFL